MQGRNRKTAIAELLTGQRWRLGGNGPGHQLLAHVDRFVGKYRHRDLLLRDAQHLLGRGLSGGDLANAVLPQGPHAATDRRLADQRSR